VDYDAANGPRHNEALTSGAVSLARFAPPCPMRFDERNIRNIRRQWIRSRRRLAKAMAQAGEAIAVMPRA
jgi:hypothetical protein